MKHLPWIAFLSLCFFGISDRAPAQGVPAAERGTAAGYSAVVSGQANLEREAEILKERLSIQREIPKREAPLLVNSNNENELEIPANILDYLAWSKEQAAIKLWPGDEEFGVVYGTFQDGVGIGSLGFVPRFEVIQVIDDENARVDLKWFVPEKWKVAGPAGGTFYKLGSRTLENVILRGMPTRGLVDDGDYRFGKVVEIVGTERYDTTTGGTKTVYVAKPREIEDYRQAFDKAEKTRAEADARQKADEEKKAADRAADEQRKAEAELQRRLMRTWTDATGKFSVTGVLVDILPGRKVKLRKEDGLTVEVLISNLSMADRKWIAEHGESIVKEKRK